MTACVALAALHCAVAVPINILQLNSVWKYWDAATDVDPSWNMPWFDDSTWKSGPARLGFGAVSPRTSIGHGNGITTYFRTSVVLPVAPSNLVVSLYGLFKSGAVIYVNGVEAWRYNMGPGSVTSTTLSLAALPSGTTIKGPKVVPTGMALVLFPRWWRVVCVCGWNIQTTTVPRARLRLKQPA